MFTLYILLAAVLIISSVLTTLPLLLNKQSKSTQQKLTPFECGFSPFNKARLPFSLRFFIMTLVFIIFDVEVSLVLPSVMVPMGLSSYYLPQVTLIMFIMIVLGLLHEWNQSLLKWTI